MKIKKYEIGDEILVYAIKVGFVGLAVVTENSKYEYYDPFDKSFNRANDHGHILSVDYIFRCSNIIEAIPASVGFKLLGVKSVCGSTITKCPGTDDGQRKLIEIMLEKWETNNTKIVRETSDGYDGEFSYIKGKVKESISRQYERDPKARTACLIHYGSNKCQICHDQLSLRYYGLDKDVHFRSF